MAVTSRLGVYGNMGSTSVVPGTEPGAGGCWAACCAKASVEIKQKESTNVLNVMKIPRHIKLGRPDLDLLLPQEPKMPVIPNRSRRTPILPRLSQSGSRIAM